MLSLANGAFDGVYSKRFMRLSKTQKAGIDLFLVSKERFFFAIYLFFDPIKLTLAVCSLCVRLCMTCFFIKNYGGGWELCGGGEVVGMCWVKIRQKCDYIICEFALFNNILWCPKICANEASSGQN